MLTSLTLVAAVRWTSVALLLVTLVGTFLVAHLVRTWFFGGRDETTSRRATRARPAARTAKRQRAAGRKKDKRK